MKDTLIISAFPGTGKTHFCNYDVDYMPQNFAIDSDSSKFDKTAFPSNYIQHIKENIGKVGIIFVSSHQEVRTALVDNEIRFLLVYPERHLTLEYIERYKNRGSSEQFIKLISANWDSWIDELNKQMDCDKIILKSGEYLSNIKLPL